MLTSIRTVKDSGDSVSEWMIESHVVWWWMVWYVVGTPRLFRSVVHFCGGMLAMIPLMIVDMMWQVDFVASFLNWFGFAFFTMLFGMDALWSVLNVSGRTHYEWMDGRGGHDSGSEASHTKPTMCFVNPALPRWFHIQFMWWLLMIGFVGVHV